MKRFLGSLASAALLIAGTSVMAGEAPKAGEKAPAFKLPGSDGKTYELSQFKGKKPVVIAWFPKAFTSGCTKECKSIRDNSKMLKGLDIVYFMASCDTPEDNKGFAEKHNAHFPILSDPGKEVAKAYGVVHEGRPVPERWTFYIDEDGIIKYVDKQVKTTSHGSDIAAKVKELGLVD